MIPLSNIVMLFYLVGAVLGIVGCSKSEPPQMKPEVVRKKIAESPVAPVKPTPIPINKQSPAPGMTNTPPPISMPTPASTSISTPTQASPTIQSPVPVEADINQKKTPEAAAPKPATGESSPTVIAYNPAGKIDPFVPLLKDDPVKPLQTEKVKREKREPMTPLERVDLSQLKLTAIIRTPSGFKAMVEESTGKGYIVGVGTYMGIHSGKVVNILKDRVVVEEEVEDALGNVANRNSELKFQKPSGD